MKTSSAQTSALFLMTGLTLGSSRAQAAPLLSSDFNTSAWPKAASAVSGGATARVTRDESGTIDTYKGKPSGAMSLAADFSRAARNASAGLSSGPLDVRSSETNLAKLSLGFDLWTSELRPIRVVVQSLNAAGRVSGSRFSTLVPPVASTWYRFSLDLDKTQVLEGAFDPKSPRIQIVWQLSDADGAVRRAANHVLRVDNVSLSTPSFYVSGQGSDDGDGRSEKTAFATIQKAVDAAGAGDVICVMDGTYASRPGSDLATIHKAGAPSAWIVLRSYPSHKPVLTSDGWNVLNMNHQSAYVEIRGLSVRGNRPRLTVEDALAQSKQSPPSALYNTNGIALDSRKGTEENGKAHHIRIIGNTVSDMPGGGISAIAGDHITVEGNHAFDNCHLMRYAGSGISVFRAWDFDAERGYKNFVIGNRTHGNRCFVPWTQIGKISDGNGIIIDDFINYQSGASKIPYQGRTLVQNNLSYGNGGSGIHAYAANHVDIVNNTAYHNALSPELNWRQIFAGGRCDDVRIFNNVLFAPRGKPLGTTVEKSSRNVVYANNLMFGEGDNKVEISGGLGAGGGAGATGDGGNNTQADPQFVRPSLDSALADFRLAPNSPAIDAAKADHPGAPLNDLIGHRRPQGNTPDLGAYEMPKQN